MSAISPPFGGGNRTPHAAISVACVPSRMPKTRHPELVDLLKSEIATMEEMLSSTLIIGQAA